jgi:ATP-dependent Clp protease protease subunit
MSGYTIPNVIAEHPRGDRIMDVYSHLLTERIIVLGTAIDPGVANTLTAQLLFLEGQSPDQEINLYINCEGGDIPSMLAIYDTIRFIKAPVATTCVGQAVAAGAVLLAAGAAGRRAMLPHARVILHQPAVSGQGTIPDLILQADELVRLRAELESVLSEHTGQSVATLRSDTDRDRIFTAQAAVDYGLADQILSGRSVCPPAGTLPGSFALSPASSGAESANDPVSAVCGGLIPWGAPPTVRASGRHGESDRAGRAGWALAGGRAERVRGADDRAGQDQGGGAEFLGRAGHQVGDGDVEGAREGGDHLARRLLAAAFDLRQVLRRDARPLGGLRERLLSLGAQRPQAAAQHLPPQRFQFTAVTVVLATQREDPAELAHDPTVKGRRARGNLRSPPADSTGWV